MLILLFPKLHNFASGSTVFPIHALPTLPTMTSKQIEVHEWGNYAFISFLTSTEVALSVYII